MSIFYTLLGFLLNAGVTLLLPAAILFAPIFHVARSGRQWTPAGATRRTTVRVVETVQFAIGLIVLGMMWTFNSKFTWPPAVMAETVESIRSLNIQVLVTGAVMGLVALFVTWRFSTVKGMLGLVLIGSVTLTAFNTIIRSERREEDKRNQQRSFSSGSSTSRPTKPPKTPVCFQLIDQLPGADVWVNGVSLGKTPIQITARELLSKVPEWHIRPRELKGVDEDSSGNEWTDPTGKTYVRWGWCPLRIQPNDASSDLYFKVDFGGVRGYSMKADRERLKPETPDESYVVTLDTVFPQWEQEIETLLDRARLQDYAIDEAWKTALQSYGEFGRRAVEVSRTKEPRMVGLEDIDPALNTMLRDVKDSASAWRLLMKIEDETRRTRSYDSGSVNGRAVDQIAPMLDPQQLIDHAIELLRTTEDPDVLGYTYDTDGRFYNSGSKPREEAALFPIAQAVWRLDQALDSQPITAASGNGSGSRVDRTTIFGTRTYRGMSRAVAPSEDNLVERLLTPELLRMSYDHSWRLRYAEIVGGSAYEAFLLRNDWQASAKEGSSRVDIGDNSNYVNEWYARLMRLRSPLGTEFRRQEQSNLLEIARRSLTSDDVSRSLFSGDLNFLFFDREYSKDHPSLAMQLWHDVKAVQSPQIRWDYLGRLWPESTPSMFIDVVDDAFRNSDSVYTFEIPGTIPVRDQYEVLMAVLSDRQKRVSQLARVPGDESNYETPRQKHLALIFSLRERLYHLQCEEAAAQLLADMKAEPDHSWHKRIADFLKYDTTHEDLIRLIATGDDIKLQRDALPAIQNHPIPGRVKLLDTLLKSQDETVRAEAAAVQAYIEKLRTQPLPHRSELRP